MEYWNKRKSKILVDSNTVHVNRWNYQNKADKVKRITFDDKSPVPMICIQFKLKSEHV